MSLRSLFFASAASLLLVTNAQATTFGLEGSLNATPTFTVTSGGNTATFSSTAAGNGFQVQNTAGLLSFGTALLDSNFFGTDPLTVSFASPLSGTVLIPFAILDSYGTGDALLVTTSNGQMLSFPGIGDGLALNEPEGIASLQLSGPTQSFTLTSSNAFAIGDISTVAATPEPGSLILAATGLAGIVWRRRHALTRRG